MNIFYEQGDLLQVFAEKRFDAIAHQCNCVGNMGAGIALKLAQTFPELEELDREHCKGAPEDIYGSLLIYNTQYGGIINLYSQAWPGPCQNGSKSADHYTVRCQKLGDALVKIPSDIKTLAIPLIASGLAADPVLKGKNSDLYYFNHYVKWVFELALKDRDIDITVVYL